MQYFKAVCWYINVIKKIDDKWKSVTSCCGWKIVSSFLQMYDICTIDTSFSTVAECDVGPGRG